VEVLAFEWDDAKSEKNKLDRGRGRGFDEALQLWTTDGPDAALNINSGEQVYLRVGFIAGKVWGAMYVIREAVTVSKVIRIVSFRRLNDRERKKYAL